jgi:hypothetical protein
VAIVEIVSAGVNLSDVKAVLGAMPHGMAAPRAGTMPNRAAGAGRARRQGSLGLRGSWG